MEEARGRKGEGGSERKGMGRGEEEDRDGGGAKE
jgi:hypothetical protein